MQRKKAAPLELPLWPPPPVALVAVVLLAARPIRPPPTLVALVAAEPAPPPPPLVTTSVVEAVVSVSVLSPPVPPLVPALPLAAPPPPAVPPVPMTTVRGVAGNHRDGLAEVAARAATAATRLRARGGATAATSTAAGRHEQDVDERHSGRHHESSARREGLHDGQMGGSPVLRGRVDRDVCLSLHRPERVAEDGAGLDIDERAGRLRATQEARRPRPGARMHRPESILRARGLTDEQCDLRIRKGDGVDSRQPAERCLIRGGDNDRL